MIGQIQALLDNRVDVDRTMLAGSRAGMQQHVLDDGIGTLAVLHDLFKIAAQHVTQFGHLRGDAGFELRALDRLLQLAEQFGGDRRKIIDEVERILDLVRDAGG